MLSANSKWVVRSMDRTEDFYSSNASSILARPTKFSKWLCGEMVNTADLKSAAERLVGSSPTTATILIGVKLNGQADDS